MSKIIAAVILSIAMIISFEILSGTLYEVNGKSCADVKYNFIKCSHTELAKP